MVITFIETLPVGNALRVFITPPAGALYWRLLRKSSDTISGPNDINAYLVADQSCADVILDTKGLVNGTPYFYACYFWNGAAWTTDSVSVSATATSAFADGGVDVQAIVRDRMALGLAAEVAQGRLKPATGKILVTDSPFALADGIAFPTVSIHMDSEAAAERVLGEQMLSLVSGLPGIGSETEGTFQRVALNIVGVSLNADERRDLRRAVKRVILANFPIFADAGLLQVSYSQRDQEQFTENSAPLYLTVCAFDCIAPALVAGGVGLVATVNQTITTYQGNHING